MPTYGGGKARLGREIHEVIKKLEGEEEAKKPYFEPFCGLLGVGIHFAREGRKVLANDINKDIILMLKALKGGWQPPSTCSRQRFEALKHSPTHSKERGFVGIACAYSGIFFAGYRIKDKKGNNFFKRARDSLIHDIAPSLDKVNFTSKDYRKFNPKGMTIYCDPPYKNNTFKSKYFDNFDHNEFWTTMRKWSRNNLVIISEYTAPPDFKVVWKRTHKSVYNSTSTKRKEKLFIWKHTPQKTHPS